MSAFFSPFARRMMRLASRIVPTPMVMAKRGTSSMLEKNRALSSIVSCVSVLSRVREPSDEPGSLKAI